MKSHDRSKSPSITGCAIMHFKWHLPVTTGDEPKKQIQDPQQTDMANGSEIRGNNCFYLHILSQEMENLWQLDLSFTRESPSNLVYLQTDLWSTMTWIWLVTKYISRSPKTGCAMWMAYGPPMSWKSASKRHFVNLGSFVYLEIFTCIITVI